MNMHTEIKRAHYISQDECLQLWVKLNGKTFIAETDNHGETYNTIHDVLLSKKLDETVTRIVRFDLDRLTGEDITEELAVAYLDAIPDHDKPCSWDTHTLPYFVQESEAWEEWCATEEFENTIPDFSEHSTCWVVNGRVV